MGKGMFHAWWLVPAADPGRSMGPSRKTSNTAQPTRCRLTVCIEYTDLWLMSSMLYPVTFCVPNEFER